MGLGKTLHSDQASFSTHWRWQRRRDPGNSRFSLKLQVLLIISVFAGFNGANYAMFCLFVKELDPRSQNSHWIFFAEAFFGSDQPGDKIFYYGEGSKFGGGSEGCLCTGPPSATLLIRSKKSYLQLLSVIHRSKYNIKSCSLSHKRGQRYKDSDIWFRIHLVQIERPRVLNLINPLIHLQKLIRYTPATQAGLFTTEPLYPYSMGQYQNIPRYSRACPIPNPALRVPISYPPPGRGSPRVPGGRGSPWCLSAAAPGEWTAAPHPVQRQN